MTSYTSIWIINIWIFEPGIKELISLPIDIRSLYYFIIPQLAMQSQIPYTLNLQDVSYFKYHPVSDYQPGNIFYYLMPQVLFQFLGF